MSYTAKRNNISLLEKLHLVASAQKQLLNVRRKPCYHCAPWKSRLDDPRPAECALVVAESENTHKTEELPLASAPEFSLAENVVEMISTDQRYRISRTFQSALELNFLNTFFPLGGCQGAGLCCSPDEKKLITCRCFHFRGGGGGGGGGIVSRKRTRN
jgi:hypothetical protein